MRGPLIWALTPLSGILGTLRGTDSVHSRYKVSALGTCNLELRDS